LAHDLLEPLARADRRRQAQDIRDQTAQRLRNGGGIGAGLGRVQEDLKRLVAALAVLVDGQVGGAQRRWQAVRPAGQTARARLLFLVKERQRFRGRNARLRDSVVFPGFPGRPGLQDDLLAAAGHIDGQALAAQVPGQVVRLLDLLNRGRRRHVDRLGDRVIDKGLHRRLHADVLFRRHVAADDVHPPQLLRQLRHVLAAPLHTDLLHHPADGLLLQPGPPHRLLEERAGVL